MLELAIELLKDRDTDGLRWCFKSPVLDVAASCLRPVFRARSGHHFQIADLSSIENVVLGWISDCSRILHVARTGLDAYKDFATEMFGKPYDQITKEERNIAKPPTLGCGYRLSAGGEIINADGDKILTGLLAYASAMGVVMTREQAQRAVEVFREKFHEVKKLWYDLEKAFAKAVEGKPTTAGKCLFEMRENVLLVHLPSGRCLHYFNPKVVRTPAVSQSGRPYDKVSLSFEGRDSKTGHWSEQEIHGGVLAENFCQAIARDVLMVGLRRAEEKGYDIVLHVHDEIGAEVPDDSFLTVKDLEECMADVVSWAPDMPLRAAGFRTLIYRKG